MNRLAVTFTLLLLLVSCSQPQNEFGSVSGGQFGSKPIAERSEPAQTPKISKGFIEESAVTDKTAQDIETAFWANRGVGPVRVVVVQVVAGLEAVEAVAALHLAEQHPLPQSLPNQKNPNQLNPQNPKSLNLPSLRTISPKTNPKINQRMTKKTTNLFPKRKSR
jgi:hypothetical protein